VFSVNKRFQCRAIPQFFVVTSTLERMFESGVIHSTCIEQGERPSLNMPDENRVKISAFHQIISSYLRVLLYLVSFVRAKWGFPGADLFQTITVVISVYVYSHESSLLLLMSS